MITLHFIAKARGYWNTNTRAYIRVISLACDNTRWTKGAKGYDILHVSNDFTLDCHDGKMGYYNTLRFTVMHAWDLAAERSESFDIPEWAIELLERGK